MKRELIGSFERQRRREVARGGPAFPTPRIDEGDYLSGLSLLDYTATAALQGMLAHSTRYKPRDGASSNWHEAIAEEAYQIAAAMLKERDKAT